MKIHIGVDHFPLHLSRIRQHCDVAEIAPFFTTKPRKKTLLKWREEGPKTFRFVLPAPWALTDPQWRKEKPSSFCEGAQGFTPGKELDFIWESLDKAAGLLRTNTFLFRTPSSFRPTRENREKMASFFQTRERKNYRFVWEPTGLWEPEEALEFARSLGVTLVQDPLSDSFIESNEPFRYLRVKNLRSGAGISEMGFEEIYYAARSAQRCFVLFSSPAPLMDAKRFKTFLNERAAPQH